MSLFILKKRRENSKDDKTYYKKKKQISIKIIITETEPRKSKGTLQKIDREREGEIKRKDYKVCKKILTD
jgi:hypothetical protein